jgi:hypothetical protein
MSALRSSGTTPSARPARAPRGFSRSVLLATVLLLTAACDRILPERADLTLPPIGEVEQVYDDAGLDAVGYAYNGNVVEVTVRQPSDQLRRGGSLWARVGPYIYLFTPATQQVFEAWEGIAAIRFITTTPEGEEVARARLARARLNDVRWQRARNILGHALREGTERPVLIEDLVHWGEEHTEYRYNPKYVPPPGAR